jgi:hypothetical protein
MSVTFWIPGDFKVPCWDCDGKPRTDEEIFAEEAAGKEDVYCFTCKATGKASIAPECNMANSSARICLEAMGIESEDLLGSMPPGELLNKVNNARGINRFTSEATEEYGQGGAHIFSAGYDADRIMSLLSCIRKVCEWAVKNSAAEVVWG